MLLPTHKIADNFAGGGGASTAIKMALGRGPDFAVNHDPEAITMHAANHPETRHYTGDVYDVDPTEACGGRHVGFVWFSPDCKHFSRAKGGSLVHSKEVRGLAWVGVRWAKAVHPDVMIFENVEEFLTWGPLLDDGTPDKERKGETFAEWRSALEAEGYDIEWRQLRACDYGAPTSRKRLFIVARRDGKPIAWPTPTHGVGPGLRPFRTAAECIDWSVPTRSIFGRARPLAEKTQARIARGIDRFVRQSPFVAPISASGGMPLLIQTGYGERAGQAPRTLDIHAPLGTVVAGGAKHALVVAFLARHYGGNENAGASLTQPMHTITTQDHHALVTATLSERTSTPDVQKVRAFLNRYHLPSVVTLRDEIYEQGTPYTITGIGMRMLTPRELFRAQGFPDSYKIDPLHEGKPLSQTAQIRMCGNSVSPPVAAALIRANVQVAPADTTASSMQEAA